MIAEDQETGAETRRQSLATDWMDAIPTMLAVGIGGIIGANLRWQVGSGRRTAGQRRSRGERC